MQFCRPKRKIILASAFVLLVFLVVWFVNPGQRVPQTLAVPLSSNAVANQQVVGTDKMASVPGNYATNVAATRLPRPASSTNNSSAATTEGRISDGVLRQIAAMGKEKAGRSPVEQKVGSQLLYADKMRRGEPIAEGVPTLRVNLDKDNQGRVLVDIKADVTDTLLRYIEALGGNVINNFPRYQAIRASVPLAGVVNLAAREDVQFIKPAVRAMHNSVDSEGDYTHQANTARMTYGADGTGVKIGVLSDSVDYLTDSQIAGMVTVLPGQSGMDGSGMGEGTAMLEIVHDLAPGAQLYFATASSSEAGFADNIQQLEAAGCNIIVDDVMYFDESPFQDGIVAQAVNSATANGVLYFSSAGNSGNKDDGTSGTWEGDFVDSGKTNSPSWGTPGHIHSFGSGYSYDTVSPGSSGACLDLFWSDPLGHSTNDYDVYLLDSSGNLVAASNDSQTGTQDPYESIESVDDGDEIVISKFSGVGRFLHLSVECGKLSISTQGSTRGHDCATNAFDVAATDANNSYPNAFTGGAANPVEVFSSDGPRRVFFYVDGTPVTPGNFSSSGGQLRQKPDITAADGVTTDVPGFAPFYGTSAASPHAAAIAALLKSYDINLTTSQIRMVLTNTDLDIMASGYDRDSGAGIVMALPALQAVDSDLTRASDRLASSSPRVGDTITASVTVTNKFCAVAGRSVKAFHVGFYWSTNSGFVGVTPFFEAPVTGCAANGSVSLNQKITIGATNPPGIYYLGYKINDESEVVECNYDDNGIYNWTVTVIPETNPPTINITSPTSGLRWTNATFTVSGTAGDNVMVTNVMCSSNNLVWMEAGTANHWSNWTAQVTLTPGTNTVSAYSVDECGNTSTIKKASFQYVVTNQLQILTSGLGNISPNYSNAWLEIGRNYSLAATPGTGFMLTNWAGGIELPLGWLTNGTTVRFCMETNLILQANFIDTSKPTLSITNVTAGQRLSNAVFTVKGKAGDNWQVSNVWCQINGLGWNPATNMNNWTNWAAGVTLSPGTNVVQAYAVDTSGNVSPTNSVSIQYVVDMPLQVQMTGLGSLSPNYTNAWLEIGRNYSLTATPGTGFMLTNWAGGIELPLGWLTNGTTVRFCMETNLIMQANFIDTSKPTLSITNLTAGQRVSNVVFTVKGKAGDNWQVSNVWCQINGLGWNSATNISNWTNWAVGITLLPGTNTFQAYAVDTSGNGSTTNSVNFQYVVDMPLQVQMTGLGSLSPNYSNAWVEIGRNYSVTATPGPGFMLTNWTGGIELPLGWLTNKATVQFMMQSNLILQANFLDTSRPTLSITNLTAGQRVSNAVFTVKGKAGDNWQVSNVWCQINGLGWNSATNISNWTNWAAGVTLSPGTNVVQAYAVDTSGNGSTTNSVSFQYVVTNQLQILTSGLGNVSPNYSNAWLEIGRNYTLTATPGTGFMLTNWTGGIELPLGWLTNGTTVRFCMETNLILQANFIDISKPTLSITNLTAGQRVSNAVFTVKGKAGDNVAVSNVFCSLNNTSWLAAETGNGWSNWTAAVTLLPGTNTVQAYAVDTSGNRSVTNTVKFTYVAGGPAPGSLNGLVAAITPDGQSTFYIGFWTNTFSQSSTDTNNNFGVGTYTYAKLSTNTARLVTTYTSPPLIAGNGTPVFLTFTTNGDCAFSNEVNSADLGAISLTASSNFVPASLNGRKAVLVDNVGEQTVMVFGSGTLTVTNTDGTTDSDTYTLKQYSPIGAQLVAAHSGKTNYVEYSFNAADYGDYFNANYDSSGNLSNTGSGVFALALQSAGGNAPVGLAGTNLLVTQQASPFWLSLGSTTFTQTSVDTNNNNGVGVYTYVRLGSNTAQLSISYTAPPTITNQGSSVFLTFIATNFGLFTNQDDNGSNYLASVSLSAARNLVPVSLDGLTVSLTNNNGTIDIVTFNSDNTFSQTESNSGNPGVSTGTYTFTPSGPVGAMARLNFTGGVVSGSIAYVQTTFTDTNTGLFYLTDFDLLGNLQGSGSGKFSTQ